jgi:hypothetical protein
MRVKCRQTSRFMFTRLPGPEAVYPAAALAASVWRTISSRANSDGERLSGHGEDLSSFPGLQRGPWKQDIHLPNEGMVGGGLSLCYFEFTAGMQMCLFEAPKQTQHNFSILYSRILAWKAISTNKQLCASMRGLGLLVIAKTLLPLFEGSRQLNA